MNNNYYFFEYMMKAREKEVQRSAREAWKWPTVKSKTKWYRFRDHVRKVNEVPCCTQPIQACC